MADMSLKGWQRKKQVQLKIQVIGRQDKELGEEAL
jgi:hypothetical protein